MTGPVLLAIETSTSRGGVAVVALDEARGRAVTRTYDGTRGHAEDLLFAVDDALAAASASRAEIAAVAVSIGPGSFTGVRVSVSTAKGLALARRAVVIVSATSLEVIAAARDFGAGTRVALLDAKRGEVYAAAFDRTLAPVGEAALLRVDALAAWIATLPAPVLVLGDAALVAAHTAAELAPSLPDAAVLAELGLLRLRAGRVADAGSLEPAYLRAPDVTLPASRALPIG